MIRHIPEIIRDLQNIIRNIPNYSEIIRKVRKYFGIHTAILSIIRYIQKNRNVRTYSEIVRNIQKIIRSIQEYSRDVSEYSETARSHAKPFSNKSHLQPRQLHQATQKIMQTAFTLDAGQEAPVPRVRKRRFWHPL